MRRLILLAAAACLAAAVLAAPAAATRPVTKPTGNVTVKQSFWPLFKYVVKDAGSRKADVTIIVAEKGGGELARIACGWQRTNRVVSVPMLIWPCDFPKGAYVWRVKAVNKEGNHQRKAWPARLTVN